MTLNTYIAGGPTSGHAMADFFTHRAQAVHDKATGWHDARAKAEADWEGPASEAFMAKRAEPNARDADALAEINHALAAPFTAWGDGVRTAKQWMERAKQVAREGELTVQERAILPPQRFTASPPAPLEGRTSAADSTTHANAVHEFEAAKALHAKKQAAFDEAKVLVQQARDLEHTAHDELRDALSRQTEAIKRLSQFKQWSQTAASATAPAAVGLMTLATDLENKSVHATRAAFEKATSQSPYATHSMWSVLTSEQRGDLISRYPQMVGSTTGIPTTDRHQANMSMLAAQRQILLNRISYAKNSLESARKGQNQGPDITRYSTELDQLEDALDGINAIESRAAQPNNYLISLDAIANARGQVIIAHGNPDTADNVMTIVPGTASSLGDAMDYVRHGDEIMSRAEQMGGRGEQFSSITYASYESPPTLLHAIGWGYAEGGSADLSQFQEGLRATHQGDAPSNNTTIGHSYGSTLVGYAARDHGLATDNIVFIGSPGVGVDHASELGLPSGHVWSGTSRLDPIDYLTPSADPRNGTIFDPHPGSDDQWFGMNPSDKDFGSRELPTDFWSGHGGYWTSDKSLDGMAKVVSGKTEGAAQAHGGQ